MSVDPERITCVAVVAMRGDGSVAAVLHAARGRIEVPAGSVEAGESPAAAARRELHEETGLEAWDLRPLGSVPTRGAAGGRCAYYYAKRWHGALRGSAEGRSAWVPPADLMKPGRATFAAHNRAAFRALARRYGR